jgi:hypothetical protein
MLKNGTLTKVINSIFANNTGKFGAGILAWGSADFVNCNIVNNIALSNVAIYGNGSAKVVILPIASFGETPSTGIPIN